MRLLHRPKMQKNSLESIALKATMAEGQGFEPWVGSSPTRHFECRTIDHSDNPPYSISPCPAGWHRCQKRVRIGPWIPEFCGSEILQIRTFPTLRSRICPSPFRVSPVMTASIPLQAILFCGIKFAAQRKLYRMPGKKAIRFYAFAAAFCASFTPAARGRY